MIRKLINWGLVVLLGGFLVYGLYTKSVTTKVLKNYQETFQQLNHPQGTAQIDEFRSKFSYYPATYRDESIKNRCVYLVGEIRSYTGGWDDVQELYTGKTVLHNGINDIRLGEFPIEIISNNGASFSFDMNDDYPYTPLNVDILAKLENDYYFWGFPDEIGEDGKDIYAVYITPECE